MTALEQARAVSVDPACDLTAIAKLWPNHWVFTTEWERDFVLNADKSDFLVIDGRFQFRYRFKMEVLYDGLLRQKIVSGWVDTADHKIEFEIRAQATVTVLEEIAGVSDHFGLNRGRKTNG